MAGLRRCSAHRRMEKRTKLEPKAGAGRRIAVAFAFVALVVAVPILISYLTTRGHVGLSLHFERIEIKSSSVTKYESVDLVTFITVNSSS